MRCVTNERPGNPGRKTIAVWGLSFKPETDDMRESASIQLIQSIIKAGGKVNAYDPKAIHEAQFYLKGVEVNYCNDKYTALEAADALILVTEWKEFRSVDLGMVKKKLSYPLIIDGRNIYDLDEMTAMGFNYYSVGRKTIYSK